MPVDEMDTGRRRFLTATASVIGGLGAACAAFPFLASWAPSIKARALGSPVEVDISKIEPGQKITVAWRGTAESTESGEPTGAVGPIPEVFGNRWVSGFLLRS